MLTQEIKQDIQQAYSRFLESKSLKPRHGQKEMIAHIARTLSSIEKDAEDKRINKAGICAIEAGTGTGKTVAYTLAVMPIAKALGKKVVISTATIALQEQILQRDIPDILKHSGLHFTYSLAKGRGRYLCLSKLDMFLNSDAPQDSLFEPVDTQDESSVQIYESMAKALLTAGWDGDRDNWPDELDNETWQPLTVDRNQCTGRRCQHVNQCSFIKARENLSAVDCIVANHDLVMSDLALGGGAILTDPEDTIYIFDEAHHLSDIAIKHFACQVRLIAGMHWFDQSQRLILEIQKNYPTFIQLLDKLDKIPPLLIETKQIYAELKPLVENLVEPLIVDIENQYQMPHYRFDHGEIPENMSTLAALLSRRYQVLVDELMNVHDVVTEEMELNTSNLSPVEKEQLYGAIGQMVGAAERQWQLWQAYAREQGDMPDSRWIQIVEAGGLLDYDICSSPLLAANTLQQFLWSRCFAAVLTSATLTALGNFQRLQMHTGMPDYAQTAVVYSPFDYHSNAVFMVPHLKSEPTNHDAHSEEIVSLLPGLVEGHLGILVLFASRRQLNDVFEMLDAQWQEKILCQSFLSKQKLVEEHIERVKDNRQSLIFGLASFAEGIDLPGELCSHVIIAKLPFAVPNNPVESGLAEWFEASGRNAFMEISLPEASQRLIQAAGRLIRNETDTGQVTLLDKRILTKRYGAQLLNALPPFRQVLEAS